MLAYKVLGLNPNGCLYSVNTYIVQGYSEELLSWLRLPYTPGQVVKPLKKGTKLFVFDTVENALAYGNHNDEYQIWECEVDKLEDPTFPHELDLEKMQKAWGLSATDDDRKHYPGTKLAGSVTLTRRIK